jgi:hypothetical protein
MWRGRIPLLVLGLALAGGFGASAAGRAEGKRVTSVQAGTITTKIRGVHAMGDDPALAIGSDGLPVIAHRIMGNFNDLGVTRCLNISCTDSSTVEIASPDRIGYENSIAIGADGLPIVAHRDRDLNDLAITKCGDLSCSTSTTRTIPDADEVGFETSIAIGADGLPVIAHLDETTIDLVVTHCADIACDSSTTTHITDPDLTGHQPAIAIGSDGLPVISHRDGTVGDLAVTKCDDVGCSSSSTTRIPHPNTVGDDTGIAIGVDGLPVISYRDTTNGDLAVTKCGNRACTSGNRTTKIISDDSIGRDTSIAIAPDGRPVIAHRDLDLLDLVVTKCGNKACTRRNKSTWISDPNNTGKDASIAIGADGLPIIAHFDITLIALAVTKCGNGRCQ